MPGCIDESGVACANAQAMGVAEPPMRSGADAALEAEASDDAVSGEDAASDADTADAASDTTAAPDPTEAIGTFWALTRYTAAALARGAGAPSTTATATATATATTTTTSKRQNDLIAGIERLARRRAQRRLAGCTPQRPLPLRVPPADPRHLGFHAGLVGDDAASAAAFLNRKATAADWRLALNVGAASLFLRYPHLGLASPALASALVGYLTRDEAVRARPRAESARVAREKRALAVVLLKLFAAEHRDEQTAFGPAVVAEALGTLVRTDAKPRHVRFAYQLLLVAPAHVVAAHPLAGNAAASVERLRNACLVTLASRLTRRLARVDAPADVPADT